MAWKRLLGWLSKLFVLHRWNLPARLLQLALTAALLAIPAAEVAAQPARPGPDRRPIDRIAERAPGRVIVKFAPTVSAAQANDVVGREGLRQLRNPSRTGIRVLATQPGRELEIIDRLRALPSVEFAEPDYVARASLVPTDPL
jgi:hypothetical protein